MLEFFQKFFAAEFMPHGHCFFWRPEILWLHVFADAVTAFSYLLIPFALVRIFRGRRDLRFNWMFLLFGLFILACGATHILAIVTLWNPIYRVEGTMKLITAMASFPTAILLLRLVPQAVAIPSQDDLRAINDSLRAEVAFRRDAEQKTQQLLEELEGRVALRTAELQATNAELRMAMEQLAVSEKEYRLVAELTPVIVWAAHAEGGIKYLNSTWQKFTGVDAALGLGDAWASMVHPDDIERVKTEWSNSVASGEEFRCEFRLRRGADGSYRWHLGRALAARDSNGRISRWYGTAADIDEEVTNREQKDRLLVESREREEAFVSLTNLMPQLAWIAHNDGASYFFNMRWCDYTGLSVADSSGNGWAAAIHPEDRAQIGQVWHHAVTTGELYEVKTRIREASTGHYRWFLIRGIPVRDDDGEDGGEIVRWFGTCTDIEEEEQAKHALQLANRDLELFAYAASHDLQEPLRAMAIYAELLQVRQGVEFHLDSVKYAAQIAASAKRMSSLLNDLRVFIQAAHEHKVEPAPVDSSLVVANVLADLAMLIEDSSATISVGEMPVLCVNPTHLHQLLSNLISNGVKYRRTDVPVNILLSSSKVGGDWQFSVKDNGIGVPSAQREQIFEIFTRLHGQEIDGTGMGLAICERLAKLYGGKIWAEGNDWGGSTFHFVLRAYDPRRIQAAEAQGTSA